jgi:hypothetical protein
MYPNEENETIRNYDVSATIPRPMAGGEVEAFGCCDQFTFLNGPAPMLQWWTIFEDAIQPCGDASSRDAEST